MRKGYGKCFVCLVMLAVLWAAASAGEPENGERLQPGSKPVGTPLTLSVFDIDATPPAGTMLAYDTMAGRWDLGLRARGVVLMGAGQPIVLCAVDWIGISNESNELFRERLALAAHTSRERVALHTLHQHDAPICDFSAEKLLKEAGLPAYAFEGSFARRFLGDLELAVSKSLLKASQVTHVSIGTGEVKEVASNRRILNAQGKVGVMRGSSCRDSALILAPEGLIDPEVTLLSFWNGEKPLAILTWYACHPQSYYLTKMAGPDFVGLARFYRQVEIPAALHLHFNGAGGNIAAGKYNDGTPEKRNILAVRLAEGMKDAWNHSIKKVVASGDISWESIPVRLPANDSVARLKETISSSAPRILTNNMGKLAWYERQKEGKAIDIACLGVGDARVLFLPGEMFVEYQLAAKAMRRDLTVAMAAYGDYGPFYIGTKEAYVQGGYEIASSPVTPEAEEILLSAIRKLLKKEN